MTTYFISRHPGARVWISRQNLVIDVWLAHLNVDDIKPGDRVIGTLPLQLAFEVCQRGASYFHLSLNVPAEKRGHELTVEDMQGFSAALRQFVVYAVEHQP